MRISTSQLYQQALTQIQRHAVDLAHTQEQVASGRNISRPSDDPVGAKHVLELDHSIGLSEQFQANADQATNRLNLEENALGNASSLLQRVRELAIAANDGVLVDADREAIAAEVRALQDELFATANARDSNREFLFSGYKTATEAFVRDQAGNVVYQGDEGQRRLALGESFDIAVGDSGAAVFQRVRNGNGTFATAESPANTGTGVIGPGTLVNPAAYVADSYTIDILANDVFEVRDGGGALVTTGTYLADSAIAFNGLEVRIKGAPAAGDQFSVSPSVDQDVFTTIDNLVVALEASGSNPADRAHFQNSINRFLTDVDRSMENLLRVRSAVGARLNAIEGEKLVQEGFVLFARETLSAVQDLDYAEAASRLQLQLTAMQASQQAFVRIQGLSLFNFL